MENGVQHEPNFPQNPLMEGGGESADYGFLGDPNDQVGPAAGSSIYPPAPLPPPPAPAGQGVTLHAPQGSDLSHMGSSETIDLEAPIAMEGSQPNDSAFTVFVTSPVRETGQGKLKGVQDSYYTYLVNTSTTLTSYSAPEMSSRRRFRDFVDLSKLLRENYRGYFVPPRPHRNMYQGKIRMSPTFIEQRRKALEKYLKQLTAHPVISRSQELRVFLEARGQLRECMDWIRLHPISPPWYEGAMKLIRQISGKERRVPSTTEVSQPVNAKRDILRSVKEGMKSFKEKRAPTIHGGKEQILRSETDRMQDFKANVDNTWKWASYWMDRVESVGRGFDGLGTSLKALHAFEAQNGFVKVSGPEAVGQGCTRTAGLHRQFVSQSAIPLSHLHDYSELMVSVLKALQTREDALNTVTTLKGDLAVKRGKLANLQATPGKDRQATDVTSDIAALESSITAAQSSYDRVSAHNTQEMTRLRGQRQLEWYDMLRGLANSQKLFATYMRDVWCQVASDLGADGQVLAEIRGQS